MQCHLYTLMPLNNLNHSLQTTLFLFSKQWAQYYMSAAQFSKFQQFVLKKTNFFVVIQIFCSNFAFSIIHFPADFWHPSASTSHLQEHFTAEKWKSSTVIVENFSQKSKTFQKYSKQKKKTQLSVWMGLITLIGRQLELEQVFSSEHWTTMN